MPIDLSTQLPALLLGLAAAAGAAPLAVIAAAPLIGGLISDPHKNNQMFTTG